LSRQEEEEDKKQQLECGEADERGKAVQPGDGATREMLSLSLLLFGQKSEQLGLNGRNAVVSGYE